MSRFTEQALEDLSKEIGHEWTRLGIRLGVSNARLQQLQSDNKHNVANAIFQMFIGWQRQLDESDDSSKLMVEALKGIDRADLARKISSTGTLTKTNTSKNRGAGKMFAKETCDIPDGGTHELDMENQSKQNVKHKIITDGTNNFSVIVGDYSTVNVQQPGSYGQKEDDKKQSSGENTGLVDEGNDGTSSETVMKWDGDGPDNASTDPGTGIENPSLYTERVEESDFNDIIIHLGPDQLEKFYPQLGLSNATIRKSISGANTDDIDLQGRAVLHKWLQTNGYDATKDRVILAFDNCGFKQKSQELQEIWNPKDKKQEDNESVPEGNDDNSSDIMTTDDGDNVTNPDEEVDFVDGGAFEDLKYDDLIMGKKIGAGAVGEVYETTFKKGMFRGHMKAAAKKLNKVSEDEVNILKRVNHLNVIKLLAYVDDGFVNLIVMELADQSLRKFLDEHKGNVPSEYLNRWLKEVCDAVQYLHEGVEIDGRNKPVIHRDIKASNCLLFEDGSSFLLKLADFSISREFNHTTSTKTGKGSLPWMAPEVFERQISLESDIYSLGVLFWEMFTQVEPRWDLTRGMKEQVRPFPDGFPQDMRDIIESCWKTDKKDRPKIQEVKDMVYKRT